MSIRVVAVVLALGVLLTGCNVPRNEAKVINVYLMSNGALYPTRRYVPEREDPYKQAFTYLQQGPQLMEKLLGLETAVPESLKLVDISVKAGIIYLDFGSSLEAWQGSASVIQTVVAQIVYTYTDFDGIGKVVFLTEGRNKQLIMGGEGYIINNPVTRKDIDIEVR